MNRRTFLKTLMALGVSLPMPLDLLAATDPEIDATWQQARDVWGLFEVGEGAVLSFANYEDLDRADAYCLPWADRLSAEEIEHCPPLQWKVSALYVEELEGRDWEKFAKAGWSDWFQGLQGPHRAEVLAELDEWLHGQPDWGWEVDYPTDSTMGEGEDRNRADEAGFAVLKALKIRVIEGECPGSSYIAAELGMPVEEANAIAAENAWTIRFVREGAA